MDHCEAMNNCLYPIAYIADCDNCRNIFVCKIHIGTIVNNHSQQCEDTLHIDVTRITKE